MKYVEQTLSHGERVIAQARYHWLYTLAAWLWLILGIWLAGLGLAVFVVMMVRKATTEIAVTNRRLIFKRGWIARQTDEIAVTKLEEVNLEQGVFGRMFGYGKLRIKGTGIGDIALPSIDDPVAFRTAIDNAKYGARFLTEPEAAPADQTTLAPLPLASGNQAPNELAAIAPAAAIAGDAANRGVPSGLTAPAREKPRRSGGRLAVICVVLVVIIAGVGGIAYALLQTDIVENVVTGKRGLGDDEKAKILARVKQYQANNAYSDAMSYLNPLLEKYADDELKTLMGQVQIGFLERRILTTSMTKLDQQIDLHQRLLQLLPDSRAHQQALKQLLAAKAKAGN